MKLLLFFLFFTHAICEDSPKPAPQPSDSRPRVGVPALQPGQTVVFLGDSITWQNLYTTYIQQYFTSRYPKQKFRFVNRGVRGDTAAEAIARLERDVVPDKPDVVLILLGMNDGGYKGYNRGLLRFYLGNLEKLVGLIKDKTKSQVVLVTSTCVDPIDYNTKRYNKMLQAMATGVVELGKKHRVPVIDLFSFFREKLQESKTRSPPIRLMLDPIHPGPAGHLVIAHHLLKYLDPKPVVSKPIVVDLKEGITHFQLTLERRGVYLPEAARAALGLVPFQSRFNRQLLIINKAPKKARLKADGQDLGVFTREELSSGVDVYRLHRSPWMLEAETYAKLLQSRWIWFYCRWDPKDAGAEVLQEISPLGKNAPMITPKEAQKAHEKALGQLEALKLSEPATYEIEVIPAL